MNKKSAPAIEIKDVTNNFEDLKTKNIKIIGLGGAGNTIASWISHKGIAGAKVINIDNNYEELKNYSKSDQKLLVKVGDNKKILKSMNPFKKVLNNSDMVFLICGLGGDIVDRLGTVIANDAKKAGAIVVAMVIKPYDMEKEKSKKSKFTLRELEKVCDTTVIIEKDRVLNMAGSLPLDQAFGVLNELISASIKELIEMVTVPSLVNLDFEDIRTIMSNGKISTISIGESDTESRISEATKRALFNPMFEYGKAGDAIILVIGGSDLILDEVSKAAEIVTESMEDDANVIWAARIDENMGKRVRIITFTTNLSQNENQADHMIDVHKLSKHKEWEKE